MSAGTLRRSSGRATGRGHNAGASGAGGTATPAVRPEGRGRFARPPFHPLGRASPATARAGTGSRRGGVPGDAVRREGAAGAQEPGRPPPSPARCPHAALRHWAGGESGPPRARGLAPQEGATGCDREGGADAAQAQWREEGAASARPGSVFSPRTRSPRHFY